MNKVYYPGSEWVYLKIYTGIKTLDQIIAKMLIPLTQQLFKEKIITNFFFIRYMDPEFHVRIRYKLADKNNFSLIFKELDKFVIQYVDMELIWKIQCDTYVPELTRYGSNSINIIENIFNTDSMIIFNIIKDVDDKKFDEKTRNLLSLIIIDKYLDIFIGNNTYEKLNFCNNVWKALIDKFNLNNKNNLKRLNLLYRENKDSITYLFNNNSLQKDFNNIRKIYSKILILKDSNLLSVNIESLWTSIIHMSLNRLFITNNVINETAAYYLLQKYYMQIIALSKLF